MINRKSDLTKQHSLQAKQCRQTPLFESDIDPAELVQVECGENGRRDLIVYFIKLFAIIGVLVMRMALEIMRVKTLNRGRITPFPYTPSRNHSFLKSIVFTILLFGNTTYLHAYEVVTSQATWFKASCANTKVNYAELKPSISTCLALRQSYRQPTNPGCYVTEAFDSFSCSPTVSCILGVCGYRDCKATAIETGGCSGSGLPPRKTKLDIWGGSYDPRAVCSSSTTFNTKTGFCENVSSAKNNGRPCENGVSAGNPVNIATGNKYQLESDFQGVGDFPLMFERTYNSDQSTVSGNFGVNSGWRHSYERSIANIFGKTVALRADGKAYTFSKNVTYSSEPDVNLRLITISGNGWQLTTEDDSLETYDYTGKLQSIKSRTGTTHTLIYGTNGLLKSITHSNGRSMTLSYDSASRLVALQDPSGGLYQYGYNSTTGNLETVTYPDQTKRTYLYNEPSNVSTDFPHGLTGIVDELGQRFATYRYDARYRAISSQHAGGAGIVDITYDANSSIVTDALGTSRNTSLQAIQGVIKSAGSDQPGGAGCSASASNLSYDTNGNIASRTDFNGNLSCYAYDLTRNLETIRVEGLPSTSSCPTDLAAHTPPIGSSIRKVATQWHPTYRLPAQIDQAEQRQTFGYDAAGNLLNKTVTDTATGQSRSWINTYNNLGQILTADGPRTDVNDVTTYTYYADSTASHKPGDLWTLTNALGHVTTFTAYDANGRLLSLTDPNGLLISFSYDPRGRLTQKTVDGNTTIYTYDNAGNLTKVTRPSGVFVRYTYDAAHRLTDISDALGGNIHYTLDDMGNRTQEDIKDANSAVVKTHTRVYDALSRLKQDIDAYNHVTAYEYDANGNRTKITDANGHSTLSHYDSLDRLIRSTDAQNGVSDFYYDRLDQLAQVTDAANHSTVYQRNALGDLLQLDSPNTGVSQYSYDSAGNLGQKTDAGNVVASYQYDALNRLLGIDYPGSEADVVNRYDGTVQNLAGQLGRLTGTRRGDVDITQRFDLRGNLTQSSVTDLVNNRTFSDVRYAYNGDDQIAATQLSANRTIENGYDATGQVNRVDVVDSDANGATTRILADNIQHLPFGPVASLNYGNGLAMSRQYDKDYRLVVETAGSVFWQDRWYDPAGYILSQADNYGESKHEFDGLGQLSSADADMPYLGWQQLGYQYDAVGNRLAEWRDADLTDFQYDLNNQHLTAKVNNGQTTAYGYNAQGQINQIGNRNLSYAPDQRLTGVVQGGTTLGQYRYDAFGHRIGKTVTTGAIDYAYDQEHRLIAETKGSTVQHTAYLDGQPLSRIDGASANSPIVYFHNNHLGAPQIVSDQNQKIVWRGTLDLFGQVTSVNPNTEQNLRFAGQYFDAETGWHYNYNRYYDPALGRYLQSDPIGLMGGVNTYTYVLNNPVNLIDPEGKFAALAVRGAMMALTALTAGTASIVHNNSHDNAALFPDDEDEDVIPLPKPKQSPKPEPRPKNCPSGTLPIDQTSWSPNHNDIKKGAGIPPTGWTGITPEGDVITSDGNGNAINLGPASDYVPSGKPGR